MIRDGGMKITFLWGRYRFCYKLKEKGWKIYFVPKVSVLHHKGVSGRYKKTIEAYFNSRFSNKDDSNECAF